jgi:integrase
MKRKVNRLEPLVVAKMKTPGYYPDGLNLYLQVSAAKTKSWVLRYTLAGKSREMGLGAFPTFSLADARERATAARKLLADGIDPLETKRSKILADRLSAASVITFDDAATRYIKTHESGWKNLKHVGQWRSTIATFASPFIGMLPVHAIDNKAVVNVLEPIWNSKRETASRLRGRIEKILDWATTLKYRTGDNPARYKGNLDNLLTKSKKTVIHHPALPFIEIGAFMATLRTMPGMGALALQFVILTATRTSEVLNAQWSEFDLDAGVWVIPKERMKADKEHAVPLSPEAVEILHKAGWEMRASEFVFAGVNGKALSNMACLAVLKRMERPGLTVHGFRSTFRDWCSESTAYPRDVAEMALAHTISNKTEAAYRRGDLFDKRTRMMADWAAYCATVRVTKNKIVNIRGRVKA